MAFRRSFLPQKMHSYFNSKTFISAAEDISILANQRPPFFAATRPFVSGGVRSGTLPPWSRDVARIAFPPGPAGSSNAQVPILSTPEMTHFIVANHQHRPVRPGK